MTIWNTCPDNFWELARAAAEQVRQRHKAENPKILWNKYKRTKNLIVLDILPEHPVKHIMVRTNDPWGGDTLFGYCSWDGCNLVSEDGDSYYLDELVTKHKWDDEGNLTYWIHSEWIGDADEET